MSNTAMTPDQFFDELDKLFGTDDGYENHLKRIKELKEHTDGIMNEEGTEHILGLNAYEKFCQAMSELNFDEEFISELKGQNAEIEESEQSTRNYWQSKYEFEKDALSKIQDERDKYFGMLQTLKEQNEQLQYELDEEKEEHENTEYDLQKLKDELEPLDEMMDKIKEVTEYEHVVDYVNGLHQKNLELQERVDEYVDWFEKHDPTELVNSLMEWKAEAQIVVPLEEHKEKIEELQTQLQQTENYWKSKFENEESTNKMLNDAIINHTEILDEIREYLSLFDGDEVEVFDKIVKGSTD